MSGLVGSLRRVPGPNQTCRVSVGIGWTSTHREIASGHMHSGGCVCALVNIQVCVRVCACARARACVCVYVHPLVCM